MKRYFWMIAIVAFIGLFVTSSANAHGGYRGGHGRHQAYRAGYHQGMRDARHNNWHGRYYGHRGYYAPRHYYPRHRYYAPRPVVRISVPVPPPPPRVIIRP